MHSTTNVDSSFDHPMTASTTARLTARHALLACLCFVAALTLAVAWGADAASANAPSAGIVVQQASHGSPMVPHRSCPSGAQSQGAGTCASVSVVGLLSLAGGHVAAPQSHSSRFTPNQASVVAQLHGSRLERPPRF